MVVCHFSLTHKADCTANVIIEDSYMQLLTFQQSQRNGPIFYHLLNTICS